MIQHFATSTPIRVLVAAAEPLVRRQLAVSISADPDFAPAAEHAEGPSALALLQRGGIELALIDVELPALNGLEVLKRLPATRPEVVLLSVHAHHAMRAFEEGAIDFLLTPIENARLEVTLARAKERVRRRRLEGLCREFSGLLANPLPPPAPVASLAASNGARHRDSLVLQTALGGIVVAVDDVEWIEATATGTRLRVDTAVHESPETMTRLSARLGPDRFLKLRRGLLVSVNHIASVVRGRGYRIELHMRSGDRFATSRRLKSLVSSPIAHWR